MEYALFRDWMRRQRAALDLTQEALAEEVGCAVQTIRAFERGMRRPSRPMAERLASALAVPPAQRAAFLQAARSALPQPAALPQPFPQAAPRPFANGPTEPAAYLALLAEQARSQLYGPEQQQRLAQLEAELNLLRAALAWALDDAHPLAEHVGLALRAASAIERFWHGRGYQAEGQRWLEQGLALVERAGLAVDAAVLAEAHSSAGWLAKIRGDTARATALLHRCVALYRTLGNAEGLSDALDTLGDLALFEGDAVTAAWFYGECLALRRGLGDTRLIALALNGLGHAAIMRGYFEQAAEQFRESLTLLQSLGDPRSSALAHHGAGLALLRQGDLAGAAAHLATALGLFAALGNALDVGLCLGLIGELLALRVFVEGADAHTLKRTAQLWGAAAALLGAAACTLSPPEQARRDTLVAAARLRAEAAPFQACWDAGGALALGEAVAAGCSALEATGLAPRVGHER